MEEQETVQTVTQGKTGLKIVNCQIYSFGGLCRKSGHTPNFAGQPQQYLLQTPTDYKLDFLTAILKVGDSFFDFAVICKDGIGQETNQKLIESSKLEYGKFK